MGFYTYTLVLRPRPKVATAECLKVLALDVLNSGGTIRKLSNEGVIKTYRNFRDSNGERHLYVRFIHLQVDQSEDAKNRFAKRLVDHPDVIRHQAYLSESPVNMKGGYGATFRLDAFTRLEEELAWPPQVTSDAYEQIEANWKEFSRARWSNFLRS